MKTFGSWIVRTLLPPLVLLAIIVAIFRTRASANVDELAELKG